MDDRELLELAAKAAGLDVEWDEELACFVAKTPFKGLFSYEAWRPLEDDGDALRLLYCLGNVETWTGTSDIAVFPRTGKQVVESLAAGRPAATRRAIVRAAAEIGEALP